MKEVPLAAGKNAPIPLYAAILGSYPSFETASQAQAAWNKKECASRLGRASIYKTDATLLQAGSFIVGQLLFDRREANRAVRVARGCDAALKGYVKRAF